MHNHDDKYPPRPGFEPGTSMLFLLFMRKTFPSACPSIRGVDPFKLEFINVIFIYYNPRIAVAILDL